MDCVLIVLFNDLLSTIIDSCNYLCLTLNALTNITQDSELNVTKWLSNGKTQPQGLIFVSKHDCKDTASAANTHHQ